MILDFILKLKKHTAQKAEKLVVNGYSKPQLDVLDTLIANSDPEIIQTLIKNFVNQMLLLQSENLKNISVEQKTDILKISKKIFEFIVLRRLNPLEDSMDYIAKNGIILNEEEKNFLILYYTIFEMESQKTNAWIALGNVIKKMRETNKIEDEKIFEIKKISDTCNLDYFFTKISREKILLLLDSLLKKEIQTIDYSFPIFSNFFEEKYKIKFSSNKKKEIALNGIFSTRETYLSGKYITPEQTQYNIPCVFSSQNIWDLLDIPHEIGNFDILDKAIFKKLIKIPANYKTKIEFFSGNSSQAINKFSENEKTVIISLANENLIAGGVFNGEKGQEEILNHCIAGLYDSLCVHGISHNEGPDLSYKNPLYSPLVGLYSSKAILIKTFKNNKFYCLKNPIFINVISSASVNMNPSNSEGKENCINEKISYSKIAEIIKMQLAIAAITQNEILLLPKFGCEKFRANFDKIFDIYCNTLAMPFFEGRFKKIIFINDDEELYSTRNY